MEENMRSVIRRLINSPLISLLVAFTLMVTVPVVAHSIVNVNGAKDTNEWLSGFGSGGCPALPGSNADGIYKSSDGCSGPTGNEYIWTDASGDQRTNHWGSTGNLDLIEMRITGDSTYLNFLLEFQDITNCGSEYIAIAIDSDNTGGTTFFPDNADTNLDSFGNGYERVIEANTQSTGYWSDNSTFVNSGSSYCDTSNDLWEIQMPIADLGLSWPANSGDYNFAVAIFCHDNGGICDVSNDSDAMDVISETGPGTWDEVSDGSLNYDFTMGFGPTAVTLSDLSARAPSPALLVASVLLLGAVIVWRRKRA
jgi:hypothetical protein